MFTEIGIHRESEVTQLCPTLCDPMECTLPGSSVHGFSRQEYWSGVPLPSPETTTSHELTGGTKQRKSPIFIASYQALHAIDLTHPC